MKSNSFIRIVSFGIIVLLILATVSVQAQTNYQLVKSFGLPDPGTQPHAGLLLGTDGLLYGTTQMGGAANRGTVFRLNPDGSGYSVLHNFSTNDDGKNPVGTLLQGQAGLLYGTTVYGGSNGCGTVYSLNTNGAGYGVLHHFDARMDGQYAYGSLIQDGQGILYGATSLGTNNYSNGRIINPALGTLYSLRTNGSDFALLHSFSVQATEGQNPSRLILGKDGLLYGVSQKNTTVSPFGAFGVFRVGVDGTGFILAPTMPSSSGPRAHMNALTQGTNGNLYGTICYNATTESVFMIGTNGTGYTVLHTFLNDGVDGLNPDTRLLPGQDNAFYGVTVAGGTNGAGTLFKINQDGSGYAILYHFKTNDVDGRWPEDSLVQGGDGMLYGTTQRGGFSDDGTVYAINPDGSGYRQLLAFNSYASEGQTPAGSLTPDGAGSLYGVTHRGGNGGFGTLFKIGLDGNHYSIVRHFGGVDDGQWPSGKMLHGQDSAWYGTTYTGGTNGFGTIFKINGDGSGYVRLHDFSGTNDGDVPYDALVQDAAGWLYGTTAAGGTNGVGTAFTLNTNGGAFTVLHTFLTNRLDGATPADGLLLGNDGALYGLTESGGTNNAGSLFKLATDGSGYAVLHHFQTNGVDGTIPGGSLLQAQNGNLYGTTQLGGAQGAGTAFTLHPDGSGYVVLQSFDSSLTNSLTFRHGAGDLVQAGSDVLYGTIYEAGGSNVYGGVLFQVNLLDGGYTTVHGFGANPNDGLNPSGRMVLAGTAWYGTTEFGGDLGDGSIYSLSVIAPEILGQPSNQSVLAGANVAFAVGVNDSPAFYQWYFNNAMVTNGVGLELMLAAVGRTDAGDYFLVISNAAGTVVSCNALLTVQVPMKLNPPQFLPDGTLQLAAACADGWPLTAGDLNRFTAQVSSNLVEWVSYDGSLTLSNGAIVFTDSGTTNQLSRFYRVLEFP